jgi:hypothetical protein
MFYQCPNCKNIWQYSIEKCPDCFSKLQEIEDKSFKVTGVSKVIIPSSLHPKVPYFVLLLENETGQKFVQKSMKEYKIGDKYELKFSNDKNAVSIWRVKYDIPEATEKAISLIGGVKINDSSKILILPTLVSVSHPYFRENTHPEVLREVIKFLIEKGAKPENIKVAGQSFTETPIEAMAKKSQLLSVCLENKVNCLDLGKGTFKRIEKEGLIFEISEEIFKNDLLINLPILKLDSKIGLRGALENLIRLWKKESFLGQKYLYDEEDLILKLKNIMPARIATPARSAASAAGWQSVAGGPEILTIADGTIIQKSNKQSTLLDLILASYNPSNLDRVFAEIAMVPLPKYLKSVKIEEIPVSGREIGEVQFELDLI